MSKNQINFSKFNNVILDPQISANYYKKNRFIFSTRFKLLSWFNKKCEFVVGGLASMIIESMIMYKKYLITALPEKRFNNQYNSSKYHTHFKELKLSNNIRFCYSLENFEKNFFLYGKMIIKIKKKWI